MEIEISVPDMITLKGDSSERSIRLENCHNQDDVMDYLKICLSSYSVNYPDRTVVESESAVPILNLNGSVKLFYKNKSTKFINMPSL